MHNNQLSPIKSTRGQGVLQIMPRPPRVYHRWIPPSHARPPRVRSLARCPGEEIWVIYKSSSFCRWTVVLYMIYVFFLHIVYMNYIKFEWSKKWVIYKHMVLFLIFLWLNIRVRSMVLVAVICPSRGGVWRGTSGYSHKSHVYIYTKQA